MSILASNIVVGYKSNAGLILHTMKPYTRSHLSWNPISKLSWRSKVQFDRSRERRNSLVVYANTVPGAPLPSTPPTSGSIKSWILGMVVSLILPFFSHKLGPLWVLKNRIENTVQTVEDIAGAVEKVAEQVEKIAEDISDNLPQGKLKDLVDFVEDVAEKTAKTADTLGDLIDKVQEAEGQVECIVESINTEVKVESINTEVKVESINTEVKVESINTEVKVESISTEVKDLAEIPDN